MLNITYADSDKPVIYLIISIYQSRKLLKLIAVFFEDEFW